MYFKDGNYLPDYKLVYSMEANWGYTMFILAMRQYCNVTFDNFKTYLQFFNTVLLFQTSNKTTTNKQTLLEVNYI